MLNLYLLAEASTSSVPTWIIDWAQIVGGVTALAAILVWLWRTLTKGLKKLGEGLDYLASISTALNKELVPNGGSSLRDAVNRMEGRQILIESRCNLILSEWDCGVFETDAAGKCNSVNKTYCRKSGRSRDELLGTSWIQVVAPVWRTRVLETWDLAIKQNIEFEMDFEYIEYATQKNFPVRVRTTKMVSYKGDVIGWQGVVEYL